MEYIKKMENILEDNSKFKLLQEDPTIKREAKLIRTINKLKKDRKISEVFAKNIRPVGSQPSRLYGLPKIHKPETPLRPVCSSINSYNYKLAKTLAQILSTFTINEYTIKNSFCFVNDVKSWSFKKCHLASFDISSLYTSIPLNETIDIACDYAFQDSNTVENLTKKEFKNLLMVATKETNFIFNGRVYDQIDGVSMGSP